MSIRLSGITSGMDTDAMVSALISGYSMKKDNLVKAQTKLSWKQDSWKAMNTKIYGFYSGKLASARLSSGYSAKSVKVSDSSIATVSADSTAVKGTQTLEVKSLATTGYLTGAKIANEDGSKISSSTKLSEITGLTGDDGEGSITLKTGSGTKTINITADMTISSLTGKLKDAGINANFDTKNQRFFLSAKDSGAASDFTLEGSGNSGLAALQKLGLDPDYSTDSENGAVRIKGQDSKIVLNGATFTSNTNSFNINGLIIQATGVSKDGAQTTLTTDTDVDAVYNSIKDLLKEYNNLVKDMDTAYSAASSKGYEPLTSEEKEAMSDDEVEEWEKKIKDSLLRRDGTLGGISSSLKTAMGSTIEVGGQKLSLASFGIKTTGYFSGDATTRGVYHIDGDSEDDATKGNEDKLKAAIASDPDKVVEFFSKLSNQVYSELTKKMKSTSLRSMYTVYNDKQMATEYSSYKTKISDMEDTISTKEDYYYKLFSKMEKAMAEANSQQSTLSSYLR